MDGLKCLHTKTSKDNKDNTKYRCFLYHKSYELSTSGQYAWTEHAAGKKHIGEVKNEKVFSPNLPNSKRLKRNNK